MGDGLALRLRRIAVAKGHCPRDREFWKVEEQGLVFWGECPIIGERRH